MVGSETLTPDNVANASEEDLIAYIESHPDLLELFKLSKLRQRRYTRDELFVEVNWHISETWQGPWKDDDGT